VEAYLHAFLIVQLDGCNWTDSRPVDLFPGKDSQVLFGEGSGWVPETVRMPLPGIEYLSSRL